jgi:uncharacterized protein (TIGR02453 family)
MSDAFSQLIDRSVGFFAELAENNSKDWLEPRKAFYRDEIKAPAELLLDVLRDEITRRTRTQMQGKLFRIHRDVRFSKDKTPYNPHLHLMWRPRSDTAPAWFFGAAPDYLIVGMGLMALQGEALTRYRAFVDADGPRLEDALATVESAAGAKVSDWGPPALKRVPKPYPADHPQGDLMRRKALAVTAPLPEGWRQDGLVPSVIDRVAGMMPLWDLLDEAFG